MSVTLNLYNNSDVPGPYRHCFTQNTRETPPNLLGPKAAVILQSLAGIDREITLPKGHP
jgi:hypothetical protein